MTSEHPRQYVRFTHGRFAVQRFWGELPDSVTVGIFSTVAVGRDGTVYVAQRAGPPVLVFAPDGTFRHAGPAGLAIDPHGISVSPNVSPEDEEQVLLVDRDAHQVLVCTPGGEVRMRLGAAGFPRFQAPFNHPTAAAAAPDGDIYVADGYGNSMVHRFDANGHHVASWGQPGSGPGEFSTPHAICVDRSNRVLVADRENGRIQAFNRNGNHLASWGGFYNPMAVSEDGDGHLYVTDQVPRVSQLRPDGNLVGRARPAWNVPHGIACAPDGRMFIAEMNPNSLLCLAPVPEDDATS